MTDDYSSLRIIALDRKLSRALQRGKGVTLNADDLDLLAEIGFVEILAAAKAKVLVEQSRERLQRRAGTPLSPPPKREAPPSGELLPLTEEAARQMAWDAVAPKGGARGRRKR